MLITFLGYHSLQIKITRLYTKYLDKIAYSRLFITRTKRINI